MRTEPAADKDTDTDARSPATAASTRLARLATEIIAPWVWVLGLPFAVAAHATGQLGAALPWGVAVTGSLIPMAVVVRGARKGRWDSHHVTNREGRAVPFVVCLVSLAAGIVLQQFGNAPHEMIALSVTTPSRRSWAVSPSAA